MANRNQINLTDGSTKYDYTVFRNKDTDGITIKSKEWEIGDPVNYWHAPLFPVSGGLGSDRLPSQIVYSTTKYAKANGQAYENLFVPPPLLNSLTLPNATLPDKVVIFNGATFVLGGRYLYTVDSAFTVTQDKDFGSNNAATDMVVFNNELIVAMGAATKIWKRDTSGTWTQASDNTYAIALEVVGKSLWRAGTSNTVSSCTTTPLTLSNWGAAYIVGDTTWAINRIVSYDGMPVVLKADGVYFPDVNTDYWNQSPQVGNYPHIRNGYGAFVAWSYLWVPTVAGLLRVAIGESLIRGPEQSKRPDYKFWVRGGVEWGEHVYLLVTDELAASETFICRVTRDPTEHEEYIFEEFCRLGSTIKGYCIGINSWSTALANTSATHDSGTQADDAAVGSIAWTTPANAATSNDTYTTATGTGTTHYLKATNFGFDLPTGATVNGIKAAVERKSSTGTLSTSNTLAGTGTNDASYGTYAWTTPGNITADDASYADTVDPGPGSGDSNWLVGSNFGFAIPSTATITGIVVTIEKYAATNGALDSQVKLFDNTSTPVGSNKAEGGIWASTPTVSTYGSSSDVWGASLTPTIVNNSNFGVGIAAGLFSNGTGNGHVDYIKMQVYYSADGAVDSAVKIVKASGAIGTTNLASASTWSASDSIAEYGNETNLWGESWAVADIEDVDFGVVLSVTLSGGATASVDYIYLTVYYTPSTISVSPALFAGYGNDMKYILLGRGAGRAIDDPAYSFGTSMELETGLIQPVADSSVVCGLLGVTISGKFSANDTINMYYALGATASYSNLLTTQEGGGTQAITGAGTYAFATRYAPASTTGPYFKFKVSGTLAAASGTNRAEIRNLFAFGYAAPRVTDLIEVNIYADRAAISQGGMRRGRSAGEVARQFKYWKTNQTVLTMQLPDYEEVRITRVRVASVGDNELIAVPGTAGEDTRAAVIKVTLVRDDIAGAIYG